MSAAKKEQFLEWWASEHKQHRGRSWYFQGRELREAAIQFVKEQLAAGVPKEQLSGQLELSPRTIDSWRRTRLPPKRAESAMVAPAEATRALVVTQTSVSPDRRYTLHAPGGLRVEGLGLAEIVALLRELGAKEEG